MYNYHQTRRIISYPALNSAIPSLHNYRHFLLCFVISTDPIPITMISNANAVRLLSLLSLALPSWGLPQAFNSSRGADPSIPSASNTTNPASTGGTTFTSPDTDFLRGVNIGGWLVLEKWMNGDVFTGAGADAADEFNFDSTDGAAEALDKHWSTWFTEADVQTLKSYGLNAYV